MSLMNIIIKIIYSKTMARLPSPARITFLSELSILEVEVIGHSYPSCEGKLRCHIVVY